MTSVSEVQKSSGVDNLSPYLFHLEALTQSKHNGGELRGGNEENWPILTGQDAAVYFIQLEHKDYYPTCP